MGARRDDMLVQQRMQLALAVLAPQRPHGAITHLARTAGVSRQTTYTLAASAEQLLRRHLVPGAHGPALSTSTIQIDSNRLRRASLVLTEVGVSQRDVAVCLAELLDTSVSVGWLHTALAQLEQAAAAQNAAWQPAIGEALAGDDLCSTPLASLLLGGEVPLCVDALACRPVCRGETRGGVVRDSRACRECSRGGGL